jgi:hypothetical protein
MIFLGIDPGVSGGVAVVDEDEQIVRIDKFKDLTGKDTADLIKNIILATPTGAECFAVLELVGVMPKQGISSAGKFMRHYGNLEAMLWAHCVKFEYVTPGKWQKEMGCLTHGNKNITKSKAQHMFPLQFVTHAIADAMILSAYARRIWRAREGSGNELQESKES